MEERIANPGFTEESKNEKESSVIRASDAVIENLNLKLPKGNYNVQLIISKSPTTNGDSKTKEDATSSFSTTQDKIGCGSKKSQKISKRGEPSDNFPLLTKLVVKSFISNSSIKDSQSNRKLYKIYPNPDQLCDDCRWLVKATKSSESIKSSSEDEAIMTKWNESRNSVKDSNENSVSGQDAKELITKSYGKVEVSELLQEAHSRLLECSILLTTQKLQKKLRKPGKEGEVVSETSLNDDWFDQIQADEDSKEGASKLCLLLERLVSKYVKSSER